jgi:conflict system STAND superfamily ATPase
MAAADQTPYVGPRPFGRNEKDLFFGRDRETRDLCSLVVAHPIVLLYAASGAGKSSLLNAGLIPLLEARGYEVLPSARVSGRIRDAVNNAGVDNVYAFNILSSWAGPSVDPRDLVKVDIASFLASRPHRKDAAGEPVLRVALLDQFEELFTFARERWQERAALIRQLAEALERDPLLRIVLVMRREFVARLETFAPLLPQALRTRFPLDELGPKAAQEAIEGPLARTDRKIEPEASQRLVEELRTVTVRGAGGEDIETVGPSVEPVQLQVACAKLWDDLPPDVHTITAAHIETYGDVDKALKRFYEDALSAAETKTGVSKDRLRLWVDRYLITPGGTRGTVYRGPESTGREERAIPNAAVDVLEEKHLIRAEARAGGERWYELTHDRFVGPIRESNRVWKEHYERRQRRWKLLRATGLGASVGVALVGILFYAALRYFTEYDRTDGAINELVRLHARDSEAAERKAPTVLGNVAAYLWQQNKLEHLTDLLKLATPVITEQYRTDRRVGAVMPQVSGDARWPIELRYNPDRDVDIGRLLYEWRVVAIQMMDTWGVPPPPALKVSADKNVPLHDVVVMAGNVETRIEVPTLRSFVLVSENEMPERLQAWFDAHKTQWARVEADALKDGGPWWLVPSWTQPLFEAAGHQVSPKEALIAAALGQVLTAQPRLTLNAQNVAYLLSRLEGAGFKRTVAEALASRGGIDGLVEDLRALVARGYPLVNLEYVLDSLAAYPRSQFSSVAVAEDVEKDQTAATLRGGVRFAGAHGATAEAAKSVPAEDIVPYRDTADRKTGSPQPLRVYLGDDLVDYFATPEGELQPRILGVLADLRGELFKRFGIVVPGVNFKGAILDPTRKLAPKAFRIELLTQTWADRDAIAIEVPDPDRAVDQFIGELRRRLLAWRTWWVTADYVDKQLERNEPLKTWLLERYALSDIKSLLRGVLAPTDAELGAYNAEGVEGALRRVAPGQSLRELNWLLGSLVFWSQAGLDGAQLVRALQDTQAARLAPDPQSLPDRPVPGLLAGIDALEQRDFPRAERRFSEAVAADRRGAIASFPAAYASRDVVSVKGALNKVSQPCIDSQRSGSYDEQARFEIEDLLARHQDAIADPDRVRLEYCLFLFERSLVQLHGAGQMRASLKTLNTPRYSSLLEANEKYFLGYWTLELSGRSFDPPPDLAAAEDWLASAFREWKETEEDEANAQSAFQELMNRYNRSLPRWYSNLLQRLAELRPKNFYMAYDLGNWLSEGSDEADVDKGRFWTEQARERIDGPAVPEADRPRLSAWTSYGLAKNYSAKSRFSAGKASQEAAQEATSRLTALIQSLRKDGLIQAANWPGPSAYSTLIDTQLSHNDIDEAARILGDSRDDGLTDSPDLVGNRFALLLAAGRTDEALQSAERARQMPGLESGALMLAALSQLVTNGEKAEYAARKFLATTHDSRDYVRLMLYWHLGRRGKVDVAKAYLDERWRGIDKDSWPARLAQGDTQVWRERLIGYYLGNVTPEEFFQPLRSREAFEASGLNRIGLSYDEIRCEAYFYDALLQAVTGDAATRSARFAKGIQEVLETRAGHYYEHLMARYLRSRGNRQGG